MRKYWGILSFMLLTVLILIALPLLLRRTPQPGEADAETTTPPPANDDAAFYHVPIEEGDAVYLRIHASSLPEDASISLSDLRYVHVLHIDAEGKTREGELIVNLAIADDIVEIFRELYKQKYPIEKMRLVDDYDADDERSMSDNNTSAFNYRLISGTNRLSRHAQGLAVDVNPLYNPYVKNDTVLPADAAVYADRTQDFSYKIIEGDLCWTLFTEHGFTWGGSWNTLKDYQHFEYEAP